MAILQRNYLFVSWVRGGLEDVNVWLAADASAPRLFCSSHAKMAERRDPEARFIDTRVRYVVHDMV